MGAEALKAGAQGLPKRIGRYEAFLQIGAGGMARVYLAVQRGVAGQKAELVVVKLLRPEVVEDEHVMALFADEARIAMRLQHPNVIRTREVIASPPDFMLAMDFHNGRSLLDVLTRIGRESLPLDEHIYILGQVLSGLSYAHELRDDQGDPFGIVHRDVSPANVLVSYTGEVKLIDFGIAKATGALAATRDGVVRGKLGYAAPEQALGKPADPRSDIYAVGIMLWEAIAGRRRVSGETWQSVLQARLDDTEPALEEVKPDVPPALAAIVKKAIARDPENRYQTAREFQADLTKYLKQWGGVPVGPSRIAAMLRPHFEQDRKELQAAVEVFLQSIKTGAGKLPLPGARATAAASSLATTKPGTESPKEETTAPIPVDSALLMISRGEDSPESSSPTVPPPAPTAEAITAKRRAPEISSPPPPSAAITAKPPPPEDFSFNETTVVMDAPSERAAAADLAVLMARPTGPEGSTEPELPISIPIGSFPGAAPSIVDAPEPRAPEKRVSLDPFGLVAAKGGSANAAPDWATVAPTPTQKKKSPVVAIAVLALGVLGLGAALIVPKLSTKTATTTAVAAAAAAAESQPTATPTARKVETVNVRISVDPPDAVLMLDGKELEGRPYVAALPMDNVAHKLTATAEGCQDVVQELHLNSNVARLLAMKCARQGLHLTGKPLLHKPATPSGAAAPAAPAAPAQPPSTTPGTDNPYQ